MSALDLPPSLDLAGTPLGLMIVRAAARTHGES